MVNKAIRGVSNVAGALLISVGLVLLFVGLIAGGLERNVGKIGDIVKTTGRDILTENKTEFNKEIKSQLEKQNAIPKSLTKTDVKFYCNQGYKDIPLTVCNKMDTISDAKFRDWVIQEIIDDKTEDFIDKTLVDEAKKQIVPIMKNAPVQVAIKHFPWIGILSYLLGGFLIFVHSDFRWKLGLYSTCFKTSTNLLAIVIFLIVLSLISADTLMGLVQAVASEAIDPSVPEVAVKLSAGIVLNWITLTTNSILLIAVALFVPFVGATVVFFFLRKKEREEEEAKRRKELLEESESAAKDEEKAQREEEEKSKKEAPQQ
jgi:hypothetical protein